MTVDPERSPAKAEYKGKTYYFCCASCAAKFRADPEKYLQAKPATAPGHASPLIQLGDAKPSAATAAKPAVYVCPMDPEVRQDRPGPCPKCGMTLEPDIPSRRPLESNTRVPCIRKSFAIGRALVRFVA